MVALAVPMLIAIIIHHVRIMVRGEKRAIYQNIVISVFSVAQPSESRNKMCRKTPHSSKGAISLYCLIPDSSPDMKINAVCL